MSDTESRNNFPIDEVIARLREAVRPLPRAAMFELAARGYDSLFEQIVACILSIRTKDEVSLPVAERLFAVARTPQQVAALSVAALADLIAASTFAEAKAPQIREIAALSLAEYGGGLPCDYEALTRLRGVGPKCANLALGIACAVPSISVDVHVHRIVNRWGYVQTNRPEQTMTALEGKLPQPYWIELNALLVPFGKHLCTGTRPRCSTCPIRQICAQVGVTNPR
ncbi:MAG: endonuclease III [Anaerolineales bacterium]|nr:endonuclease III [Anaerolineales bacterium]MCB9126906.1 endonuclease III [Ardenticatenales bacterium]MCB9171450.1 endonuclease III [Ardenticatenales bacterium]